MAKLEKADSLDSYQTTRTLWGCCFGRFKAVSFLQVYAKSHMHLMLRIVSCCVCTGVYMCLITRIQYNLNGSNTDGSFTVDDSKSFFSPYKILPIAQENKYLGIFSYFIMELYVVIMELYVVCTH